jgi:hypothetical protein
MTRSREHELKCWREYFDPIASGQKTFTIRRDDRGFHVGDTVRLRRYDLETGYDATAPQLRFRITYIQRGGQHGLGRDYCVLALGE